MARIGLSMLLLQLSIGAVNDLVDAPRDARTDRPKPIARGLIGQREAGAVAGVGLLGGFALAATFGIGVAAVAALGVGLGNLHNLVTRGTAWAWLPLVLALPLVPVYGWLAGAGSLPPGLVVLVPAAGLAGAALAIANAASDLERDAAVGRVSIATRLGPGRSWMVGLALWSGAISIAIGGLAAIGGLEGSGEAIGLVAAGSALVVAGILLAADAGPQRRQRAWEVQAMGAVALGAGWLAAIASA